MKNSEPINIDFVSWTHANHVKKHFAWLRLLWFNENIFGFSLAIIRPCTLFVVIKLTLVSPFVTRGMRSEGLIGFIAHIFA